MLLLLFIIIVCIILLIAASSLSNYKHTATTHPKTGEKINRYPKSLVIVNNTGSRKGFHINHDREGYINMIDDGETWEYGINPSGIKNMTIKSYDDLTINFTFPCLNDTCSSADSEASCVADISESFERSVILNTYENEKKVFTANVFTAGNCPDNLRRNNVCIPPTNSNDESDVSFYVEMKDSIHKINIPYTDKTVYELVYY